MGRQTSVTSAGSGTQAAGSPQEREEAVHGHPRHPRRLDVPATIAVVLLLALVAAASVRAGAAQVQQSPPSLPDRVSVMRYHFLEASDIHEAVIRGDLAGARAPAEALARMAVPRDTLTAAVPFVMGISAAAGRVREAKDLTEAASATALVLRQCGECHQALRVRPTPSVVRRPDVGGLVGHMLEHQRALDALLQGLIIPSATEWRAGADRLKVAPLHPTTLPSDPKWTAFRKQADARLHQITDRAQRAENPLMRGAVYADLLTTCAECHSLHSTLWGPRRPN